MKKFTLMLFALLAVLVTYAAGPQKQFLAEKLLPVKTQVQLGQHMNAKPAPQGLVSKMQAAKARASKKKAAATAADLEGSYTWNYLQADDLAQDVETIETAEGKAKVKIAKSETTAGGITISGMFTYSIEATIESDEFGEYIAIESGQLAGTSSYGDYVISGVFYYEGDEEYEARWYNCDIYGFIGEDGVITFDSWIGRVLTGGMYDGYSLAPYWVVGSTLTPSETEEDPETNVVVLPEGVEAEDYVMSYTDEDNAAFAIPVQVAVDGNDVYFQGLSTYLPEAWVKGTKDGNTVTFPAMQYMGEYSYYGSVYAFYNGAAVFTYDAEAETYSAQGEIYGVLADRYYDGHFFNPVLKKVVEKAGMPANPAITAITPTQYGDVIEFNVPLTDVEGNSLLAAKLSYQFYIDIEKEVSPLVFTTADYTYLTEDMSVIPFGFTENYDFYSNFIYLNMNHKNWNKVGIKSIYTGGGETNETEIQWYTIKEYAGGGGNSNVWVAADQGYENSEEVTEIQIAEGVKGVLDKAEGKNAPKYYDTGTSVRMYAGNVLTVTSAEPLTEMAFAFDTNGGVKMPAFDVSTGTMEFAEDGLTGTWTGNATEIVFTVPNVSGQQTRIQKIQIGESAGPEPVDDELVTLPEGVEAQEYTLTASGATSQSNISIEETKLVAFDGDDVYVQGLAYWFPEAFIKGKVNGNKVIFKSGQYLGEDEYGKEYLVGLGVDDDDNLLYDPQIVFDYDAKNGTLSLVEGTYYGESESPTEASVYTFFSSAVYTPGAYQLPDVVTLPEGVEAETWYLSGTDYYGSSFVREVGVAIDGTDIYLQGICEYLPQAYVKGTLSGQTATFATGQFYGIYENDYKLFFVGMTETDLSDVTFTYDAEKGVLIMDENVMIALTGDAQGNTLYDLNSDVEITREKPEEVLPVEAPEGLQTSEYTFKATKHVYVEEDEDTGTPEHYEEEAYEDYVLIGFDGNDVYARGLAGEDYREGWVKGTLSADGKTITFPANQFMGKMEGMFLTNEYYFTAVDEEGNLCDAVFNYDAEAGKLTTDQQIFINGSAKRLYYYSWFSDVVITKKAEFAATPAAPEFVDFNVLDAYYPSMQVKIPATDTEGNDLLKSKLFYSFEIETANGIEPLVFTTDLYEGMAKNTTEIGYDYEDSKLDVYSMDDDPDVKKVYLNWDEDVIKSWKKIGVKSIYYGGGEKNETATVWFNSAQYFGYEDEPDAIQAVAAQPGATVYFDLQGRQTSGSARGLLIKQVRQADGSVKTAKVVK